METYHIPDLWYFSEEDIRRENIYIDNVLQFLSFLRHCNYTLEEIAIDQDSSYELHHGQCPDCSRRDSIIYYGDYSLYKCYCRSFIKFDDNIGIVHISDEVYYFILELLEFYFQIFQTNDGVAVIRKNNQDYIIEFYN